MSIKALVESIETARINNQNLGVSMEGKLNELLRQIEDTKRAFSAEFAERDRDLIRLMEGAA
jgi:hypothetical protein